MTEGKISPWFPEQDQRRLAILGKLSEELAELTARTARCIIHGLDEVDPDSGRTNREEMSREIADVHACLFMADRVLGVDYDVRRAQEKADGFERWHQLIQAGEQ